MPIEYLHHPSKENAAAKAAAKLNDTLSLAKAFSKNVLLLLSGGSALDLLNGVDSLSLDEKVTIGVLDERYSTDPAENNFAQVVASPFYKKAQDKGCEFIDTRVRDSETQEVLAARLNSSLIEWTSGNPDGVIIATVGMGDDGHTSGIMPYPENPDGFEKQFNNSDSNNLVTSYNATGKNKYAARITTNMNLLRKINTAVVYITGEGKRAAFKRLNSETGSLAETPARIWNEILGEAVVFTDIN